MGNTSIFISHSHHDSDWCRDFIMGFNKSVYDIWYDEKNLVGGEVWMKTIEQEIPQRDIFMLILSPDSEESIWVEREYRFAVIENRYILPVEHKKVSTKGFLKTYQHIDVVDMSGLDAANRVTLELVKVKLQSIRAASNVRDKDVQIKRLQETEHSRQQAMIEWRKSVDSLWQPSYFHGIRDKTF